MASSPKSPDPYKQASSDQRAQQGAAYASSIINNPNEQSNYGSVNYKVSGWEQVPDAQGKMTYVPRYTRTTTLSPDEQRIAGYDTATRYNLGRTATQQSAKIGDYLNKSIDPSSWQAWGLGAGPGEIRQDQGATDRASLEKAMLGRFNTDFAQQSAAQDAQLAARGMSPGSQGYSDVQQGRDRARTDATQQAYLASGQESRAAQEAYNQATQQRYELGANYADRGNQLRQAQMEEAFAMRNQPINEIMALLGGSQVNMPNFSPYSRQGISASSPGGYQQQNYQNKLQQTAATNEGLFGLGKAALTGYFSSDRRLKEDILPLGMTLAGAPLYRFRYRGQPELQIGVMSDEVRALHPDAVITNPDGFDMVNYGLLAERAGGFSNG